MDQCEGCGRTVSHLRDLTEDYCAACWSQWDQEESEPDDSEHDAAAAEQSTFGLQDFLTKGPLVERPPRDPDNTSEHSERQLIMVPVDAEAHGFSLGKTILVDGITYSNGRPGRFGALTPHLDEYILRILDQPRQPVDELSGHGREQLKLAATSTRFWEALDRIGAHSAWMANAYLGELVEEKDRCPTCATDLRISRFTDADQTVHCVNCFSCPNGALCRAMQSQTFVQYLSKLKRRPAYKPRRSAPFQPSHSIQTVFVCPVEQSVVANGNSYNMHYRHWRRTLTLTESELHYRYERSNSAHYRRWCNSAISTEKDRWDVRRDHYSQHYSELYPLCQIPMDNNWKVGECKLKFRWNKSAAKRYLSGGGCSVCGMCSRCSSEQAVQIYAVSYSNDQPVQSLKQVALCKECHPTKGIARGLQWPDNGSSEGSRVPRLWYHWLAAGCCREVPQNSS